MKNILLKSVLVLTLLSQSIVVPVQAKTAANCASSEATKVEAVTDSNGITTYQDNFSVDYYSNQAHSNAVPESTYTYSVSNMASNALVYDKNNVLTIATNPVGRWATSTYWNCTTSSADSSVQIPLTASSGGMLLNGKWQYTTAANLELANADLKKVHSVHTYAQVGARSVRFLVSEDEKSFYEIGFMSAGMNYPDYRSKTEIPFEYLPDTTTKTNRTYFRKVVNGVEEQLDISNANILESARSTGGNFTLKSVPADSGLTNPFKGLYCPDYYKSTTANLSANNWTELDASMDYSQNKITVSILSQEWGGLIFEYTDAGLGAMAQNAYFPASVTASHDSFARLSGFRVSYEAEKEYDYYEDFTYTGSSDYEGTELGSDADSNNYIVKDVDGTMTNVSAPFTANTNTTVFENNGASYIYGGLKGQNNGTQIAYVGLLKNTNLTMADRYWKGSTVNVNVGTSENPKQLSKIHVSQAANTWIGTGVKLLSDSAQKYFYIVGIMPNAYNSLTPGLSGVTAMTPYIAKVNYNTNKTEIYVAADTAVAAANGISQGNVYKGGIDFDIDVGYNTIDAVLTFGSTGQKIPVSLKDDSLTAMRKNTVYPVSLVACGDGYAQYDKVAMNFDGFTVTPDPGYSFVERFNAYNEGEYAVGTTAAEIHSIPGTAQTIAAGSGYKWLLSGNVYGYHKGDEVYSKAYVDYSKEEMGISDFYQTGTTVNLDTDADIIWVDKLEFSSRAGSSRRGIRALVNNYEDTYWEFCTARAYDSNLDHQYTGNQPYVRRVKNGVVLNEWLYTEKVKDESGNITSDTTAFTDEDWVITFGDDGTVTWTVTDTVDNTKTWTGSYVDPELDVMMENIAYPAALYALGDGYSYFDNVKLSYAEDVPVITDKAEGGYTVSVQPAAYRRFLAADQKYMTVITAYYAADGKLITADSRKIDDVVNLTQFDIQDKTEKGAARGKLFIWSGSIVGAKRLLSQEF